MILPPRVRVACDGLFTRVLGPNGESIECTELRFEHLGDGTPRVMISLLAIPFDADGVVARYVVFDPNTRTQKEVRRLEFADGSEWIAE